MATKTKAELMEEIKDLEKKIKDLEKEIKNLESFKKYDNMADELAAVHDSFIDAGFDEDQAFTLLIKSMELSMSTNNTVQFKW